MIYQLFDKIYNYFMKIVLGNNKLYIVQILYFIY